MIEIGKSKLKRITREVYGYNHDKRKLVVSLEATDLITVNEFGRRQRYSARVWDIYNWLVRSVAEKARMEKLRLKKQRKAERLARQRLAVAERRFHQRLTNSE